MAMKRDKGIIVYGTEDDRLKLALLAHLVNKSSSEYLIKLLRDQYSKVYGDTDPKSITLNP